MSHLAFPNRPEIFSILPVMHLWKWFLPCPKKQVFRKNCCSMVDKSYTFISSRIAGSRLQMTPSRRKRYFIPPPLFFFTRQCRCAHDAPQAVLNGIGETLGAHRLGRRAGAVLWACGVVETIHFCISDHLIRGIDVREQTFLSHLRTCRVDDMRRTKMALLKVRQIFLPGDVLNILFAITARSAPFPNDCNSALRVE